MSKGNGHGGSRTGSYECRGWVTPSCFSRGSNNDEVSSLLDRKSAINELAAAKCVRRHQPWIGCNDTFTAKIAGACRHAGGKVSSLPFTAATLGHTELRPPLSGLPCIPRRGSTA